ncbi:hypothetical protein BD410DRAFT_893843 [Rickenella mellea]|uniref:BTB domain-containing protein n=1 Tax=Rickenella mellea TaxID=50990 RepID=A0A4Y7QMR2_9AGAM|nr:hypothetical protein BD410DRAFT_893843 [Rickenella mellea]
MPLSSSQRHMSTLQQHLYNSFLTAETPDVALHVRGTWEAVYRLHRVVLIQAGFFRSLFTGGFLESVGPQEVDVTFDDPNITRAAFEVSIARLYGGGPPLHVDPHLIPSPRDPLSSSFPYPPTPSPPPQGHHPATPRFLLSLIATSVYLSIPSICSQALLLVMTSVGPHTAVRYLRFAIGEGIGERDEDDEPECAVGLEHVGLPPSPRQQQKSSSSSTRVNSTRLQTPPMSPTSDADDADITRKMGEVRVTSGFSSSDADVPEPESMSSSTVSLSEVNATDDEENGGAGLSYHYGPVSDKVGEAAACWLTRWGTDMLPYEEEFASSSSSSRRTASPDSSSSRASPSSELSIPTIWRRGGLSAKWIRAILSSDAFFVRSERERYSVACRVVELRRRQAGVLVREEEREWEELFARGIYYSHIPLDDLILISQDNSPTTGRPYVPLSVLQAANWSEALLRQHVTARMPSSPASATSTAGGEASGATRPRSPTQNDKELGIAATTAEILASLGPQEEGVARANTRRGAGTGRGAIGKETKQYYPVPVDASVRIGDSTGLEGASMDQLFSTPSSSRKGKSTSASSAHSSRTSPSNFFGLLSPTPSFTAPTCIASDSTGKARWSPFPPLRFGVEFWGVESLREKMRLHSQTVWYAGSLFNVYVQVVRGAGKKGVSGGAVAAGGGVQLGVYLHRQSFVERLPVPSVPPMLLPAPTVMTPTPTTTSPTSTSTTTTTTTTVGERHARNGSASSVTVQAQAQVPGRNSGSSSGSTSASRPPSRNNTASAPPHQNQRSTTPSSPTRPSAFAGSSSSSSYYARASTPSLPHAAAGAATSTPSTPTPPPQALHTPPPPPLQPHHQPQPHSQSQSHQQQYALAAPQQPYRDPRASILAYFTILCASATGASTTRFASAPDVFSVGQSWGWKSSALRTEEYVCAGGGGGGSGGTGDEGAGGGAGSGVSGVSEQTNNRREVSLRATVVLGIV